MTAATRLLILGYGAMLCVVGLAGIVAAPWELRTIFGLDPAALPDEVRATLLNQYRFLKAVEFGAGVFCLGLRRRILAGGPETRMFVALVAAGVIARSYAWIADGRPATAFIVFLLLEAVVLLAVLAMLARAGRSRG